MMDSNSKQEEDNGFVVFDDYCPSCSTNRQNLKEIQNQLNTISRDVKMLHNLVESLAETTKNVQSDQSTMLLRITNTMIRSGIAFPFVAQPTESFRRLGGGIFGDNQ